MDTPPTMSQFASREACLSARDKWFQEQLEAAKQRELELLAVIEKMNNLWVACGHDPIEQSQALREHEAEVVAEYKQRAEAAEAKLRELEMQEPYGWYDTSVSQMFFANHPRDPDYEIPLYAKPFPAPKQEGK